MLIHRKHSRALILSDEDGADVTRVKLPPTNVEIPGAAGPRFLVRIFTFCATQDPRLFVQAPSMSHLRLHKSVHTFWLSSSPSLVCEHLDIEGTLWPFPLSCLVARNTSNYNGI